MIFILKFVHFFAIALGVGGGFAGLLMGRWARDKPAEFKATLAPMQARLARLGFFSLVLLWVSGLMLANRLYGGLDGIWMLFWIKLLLVTLLTLLSIGVQLISIGVLPARWMADPARRMKVSVTASTLGLLILIAAALAFG